MSRSNQRRKRNKIDIILWFRLVKNAIANLFTIPGSRIIFSIILIISILVLFVFYDVSSSSGKIHSGVYVGGFDVGNMSKKQAITAFKKVVTDQYNKPISLKYLNNSENVTPASLNVKIDYDKTMAKAANYLLEDNLFVSYVRRIGANFKPVEFDVVYKVDNFQLDELIHRIGGKNHKPAQNANIVINVSTPVLVKEKSGFGISREVVERKIVQSIISKEKIVLKPQKLIPQVNAKIAKKYIDQSKMMISNNVFIKYKNKKWAIEKKDLIAYFETKIEDNNFKVFLDDENTKQHINKLTNNLNRQPANAEFKIDGSKVYVDPSTDGLKVDVDKTYKNLMEAVKQEDNRVALTVVKTKVPARTTSQAKKMGIKELISTFTTRYPAGKPRVKNIHLLATLLDGMMIAPGQTFSFNGKIGKRTVERGFVSAPEIRDGEFVETVGGGICQVSTTIFNSALIAGFPIGQRSPHSFFIKKYPPGRDAAVSYPQPDLTFTNDTASWVLIKGGYSSTSVTISFYSTDYGRDVSFIAKSLGSIPFSTKEIKDPALEKGKRVEEEPGILGARYKVIRIVKKDGKVTRETEINSTFKPKPRKVKVGTKLTAEQKKKEEEAKKKLEEEQQ